MTLLKIFIFDCHFGASLDFEKKNFEKYYSKMHQVLFTNKRPIHCKCGLQEDSGIYSNFQEQLIDLKNKSSIQLSYRQLILPKFLCQISNKYPIVC